jgi:hypothetical protein
MPVVPGRRLLAGVMAVASLAGCGTSATTLHTGGGVAGSGTSLPSPVTALCSPAEPGLQSTTTASFPEPGAITTAVQPGPAGSEATSIPTTTSLPALTVDPTPPQAMAVGTTTTTDVNAAPPTSRGPGDTATTACAIGYGGTPSTTGPSTTAAPTTTAPTIPVPGTTATTVPARSPACSSGPSLTLTPSSGPLGTRVTETAKCFPPNSTVTFEVPQSRGVGFRAEPTDPSGTATLQFTYSSPNGIVGSITYPLLVSTDPSAGVDHSCPPSSCATATFYER